MERIGKKEGRGSKEFFWHNGLKSFLKVRKFQKQTFFAFNSSNFSLISALASKFKKITTHTYYTNPLSPAFIFFIWPILEARSEIITNSCFLKELKLRKIASDTFWPIESSHLQNGCSGCTNPKILTVQLSENQHFHKAGLFKSFF